MRFTPQDEEFRAEVRAWLEANLTGEFAGLRGAGGPGREHERHDERLAWNRHLAAASLLLPRCPRWAPASVLRKSAREYARAAGVSCRPSLQGSQ